MASGPHLAVSVELADTGTDSDGASEAGKATYHVHNAAASKVDHARLEEEVIRAEGREPAGAGPHPCVCASTGQPCAGSSALIAPRVGGTYCCDTVRATLGNRSIRCMCARAVHPLQHIREQMRSWTTAAARVTRTQAARGVRRSTWGGQYGDRSGELQGQAGGRGGAQWTTTGYTQEVRKMA